jgi:hypothetical protein
MNMQTGINPPSSSPHSNTGPREKSLKWSVAVGLISLFWVIGSIIGSFAVMFEGFSPNVLPLPQRLLYGYGQLEIPLFGVVAAATWVLSDVYFRGRWIQWFLFTLFACVIVVIFVVLMAPIVVVDEYKAPR